MNKRKHSFEGMGSVFSFTFRNQASGKGYVVATFILPIVFFLIFAGINVGVAYFSREKEKDPINIDTVFLLDETEYNMFGDLFAYAAEDDALKGVQLVIKKNTTIEAITQAVTEDPKYENKQWGILSLKLKTGIMEEDEDGMKHFNPDEKCLLVTLSLPEDSEVNMRTQEDLLAIGSTCASMVKITAAQVTTEQYTILNTGFQAQVIVAGEKEDNMAVQLIKSLMPMIITIIMYMMIILYCQGMGKVVVSEKSSKLMEMMLTSIQPMALIAGKVLAMIVIALLQFFLWIGSAVLGFVVGDIVAKMINPDYANVIMMVIDMIRDYGMSAFSVPGVILALLAMIFGFAQYCMISALVASTCSKAEEVAERQGIYMLILIGGYFLSMFASVNEDLLYLTDLLPISAAFRLPCDALLGLVPLWVSIVSVVIMVAMTAILAYLAGKVYYAQVFLRGQSMSSQMKKLLHFFTKKKVTDHQK